MKSTTASSNTQMNKSHAINTFGLIAVVCLVILVVTGMLAVNIKAITAVKSSIISVVDNDVKEITRNAAMGRTLHRISSETDLLVNTFTRQEVLLLETGTRLLSELKSADRAFLLNGNTFTANAGPVFHAAIKNYITTMEKVLDHCKKLDGTLKQIRRLDQALSRNLSALTKILSDEKMTLMAEGGGHYLIEKVSAAIPVYQRFSLQIANQIYRLNQENVVKRAVPQGEKQKFLVMLDRFDTALSDLALCGSTFAGIGRHLRQDVASYETTFSQYHGLLNQLNPLLMDMDTAQTDIMALSAQIDDMVNANSQKTKKDIADSISSFTLISTGMFLTFNILTAGLCVYLIKLFKIRRLARDLQKAMDEIKTLQGIIPICASCKKIRDDKGYWEQIEVYLCDHSEAEFSHGICPECMKRLYPDIDMDVKDAI